MIFIGNHMFLTATVNGHTAVPFHRWTHCWPKGWIPSVSGSVTERRKPNCTLFGRKGRYSAGPRPTPDFKVIPPYTPACSQNMHIHQASSTKDSAQAAQPLLSVTVLPAQASTDSGRTGQEAREYKGQAAEDGRARGPFRPTRDYLPRVYVCSQLNSWGTNLCKGLCLQCQYNGMCVPRSVCVQLVGASMYMSNYETLPVAGSGYLAKLLLLDL